MICPHPTKALIIPMLNDAMRFDTLSQATRGRIINHLAHGIEEPRNDILFVGYTAAGTSGRTIQQQAARNGTVLFDGLERIVRAGVHTPSSATSDYADQTCLLNCVAAMPARPRTLKLVHGEATARCALTAKLAERGHAVC